MGIDLTGGLPQRREHFFTERPDDPEMRDSASMWIFDDRGEIAIPGSASRRWRKTGTRTTSSSNVCLADGRVFRAREPGTPHSPLDAAGRPRASRHRPVEFRCITPYQAWTVTYRGAADATTTARLIAGDDQVTRTDLEFHVETTMAVPPWEQGTLSAEARDQLSRTRTRAT